MRDKAAKSIYPPGGTHRLATVRKACDEAKRRLQSNCDGLKRRQEEAGHRMKKYKELLRQLETGYKYTMEKIRRHKDEQVCRSCPSHCWIHSAGSNMSYTTV